MDSNAVVLLFDFLNLWIWINSFVQVKKYSGEHEDSKEDEENDGGAPQSVAFWGTVSEAFGNTDESKLPPEDDDSVGIRHLFHSDRFKGALT